MVCERWDRDMGRRETIVHGVERSDKLRCVSFGRIGRRKMPGNAFAYHAASVSVHHSSGTTREYPPVLHDIKRLWPAACPGRPKLTEYVVQVHKDCQPAVKHACCQGLCSLAAEAVNLRVEVATGHP